MTPGISKTSERDKGKPTKRKLQGHPEWLHWVTEIVVFTLTQEVINITCLLHNVTANFKGQMQIGQLEGNLEISKNFGIC